MRFLTTILFAAAGAWVMHYNATHTDGVLMLPMIDAIDPSVANNPQAMGARSAQVLFALAGVFALWDTAMWLRQRRAPSD